MTQAQKRYRQALTQLGALYNYDERRLLKADIIAALRAEKVTEEAVVRALETSFLVAREVSLGHSSINALMLYEMVCADFISVEQVEKRYGKSSAHIVDGLRKAYQLYERNVAVETENFRKLLISLASDVRVILIMIVERLYTMRTLERFSSDDQQRIAREVSFLYAPLAHRMGLYAIKTELEDLSLKYTNHEVYKEIAANLSATKVARDAYIAAFIAPVKERLEKEGLTFSIKGRTKSIHSIWNKISKQNVTFDKIYDLFAIRIIIDTPFDKEKAACWQAFSVVTDMYTANTKRLRDWISMPKVNGYESLHVTVMGPEGKWVEVQIRTERMDEVAEKGLAAHWKYKGGKSDSQKTDEWLKNLRDLLESGDGSDSDVIDEFKMQLYDEDVFVFTPKGDLQRLGKGATLLDFAYLIHSNIGNHCVGGVVNNKHVTIKYVLKNGDQVSVQTSPNQKPKADWLNIVRSTRSRSKIRQALKELEYKDAESGRELLQRRLKNWKLDITDADIIRESKRLGYKSLSDFYQDITHEKVSLPQLRDALSPDEKKADAPDVSLRSVESYSHETDLEKYTTQSDVLVVDKNLKNVDYSLAKCCHPIYGDEIFGFVSVSSGIKIHKRDCPNAPDLIARYGYRIVNARWSGAPVGSNYPVTLRIVGHDDIGIVTNITSLITKDNKINMRSISVDSNDGLFEGNITVMVSEAHQVAQLMKKIQTVKGVKQVFRI